MAQHEGTNPEIKWEGGTWFVTLPVDNGKVIEATWKPGVTYVVRIRKSGTEQWSFGIEIPVTGCTFVDLNPDTEYELQVRAKNAAGEGTPALFRVRTTPTGNSGNVIPFPKQ